MTGGRPARDRGTLRASGTIAYRTDAAAPWHLAQSPSKKGGSSSKQGGGGARDSGGVAVDARTRKGQTPLHLAAMMGRASQFFMGATEKIGGGGKAAKAATSKGAAAADDVKRGREASSHNAMLQARFLIPDS